MSSVLCVVLHWPQRFDLPSKNWAGIKDVWSAYCQNILLCINNQSVLFHAQNNQKRPILWLFLFPMIPKFPTSHAEEEDHSKKTVDGFPWWIKKLFPLLLRQKKQLTLLLLQAKEVITRRVRCVKTCGRIITRKNQILKLPGTFFQEKVTPKRCSCQTEQSIKKNCIDFLYKKKVN